MSVIEVRDLHRVFRTTIGVLRRKTKEIVAVDGISFDIQEGELFGLLGPNGAGKTTTVKMLTTLLIPTAGTAHVLGHDVVKEAAGPSARTSASSLGASEGSTGGCRPWTTCATSPTSTWWNPTWPGSASPTCWNWWA